MKLRRVLKRSETVVGVVRDSKKILATLRASARGNGVVTRYLASAGAKKLQIGAGHNMLTGWLSTDITPLTDDTMYLDATKRFPFVDATFDYAYSEHMIEHITWQEGALMLQECRRVLKPGGTIRIATPDLEALVGLYARGAGPVGDKYIAWITDTGLSGVTAYKASFVLNAAFYNWGHRFLYDADLLDLALRRAGFTDARRCAYGESSDDHLRGIESHGKGSSAEDMVRFETLVLEATAAG